jgi:hypothetical protein
LCKTGISSTDDAKPRLTPDGKFTLPMIAGMIPVFIAFAWFGKESAGVGTCVCLPVVAFAVRVTWGTSKRV